MVIPVEVAEKGTEAVKAYIDLTVLKNKAGDKFTEISKKYYKILTQIRNEVEKNTVTERGHLREYLYPHKANMAYYPKAVMIEALSNDLLVVASELADAQREYQQLSEYLTKLVVLE